MSHGRIWIELDPDGDRYCKEPGFYYSISGADFAAKLKPDPKQPGLYQHSFFSPPGLEWLLPVARQFDPLWYRDSRLDQHVIPRADWTFAAGVLAAEFDLTKKADGTAFPANKWVHITSIPSTAPSLDATNYTALGTAAGVTLPAGMVTIATASTTPVGASLTTAGNAFTPMLQWSSPPAPDDALVFGWGPFAMILAGDQVMLCRSPNGDRATWEKIGGPWSHVDVHGGYQNPWTPAANVTAISQVPREIQLRMFKALVVGFQHLAFYFSQGGAQIQKLREDDTPADLFTPGYWWWGAAPGQHWWYQAQVMGYEDASTTFAVDAGKPLILWDLGSTYKPTVAPTRAVAALVYADRDTPDIVTDDTAGIVTYSSAATGNTLAFSVTDESGNAFAGDGTHHAGGFSLSIQPSTPGGLGGAYLAPQLRRFSLKFPVVQVPRINDPLMLNDLQFEDFEAEASYHEPHGKTVTISLGKKPGGLALYYAHGFHKRGNFPVHIWEDQDGDDVPDTIIVRGWVHSGKLKTLVVRSDDGTDAIRENTLTAHGLLSRCDRKPSYLPQLVDPSTNNRITHTYAAKEVFLQAGFDPDVDTFIHVAPDPLAGTNWEVLPNTDHASTAGQKAAPAYGPTWEETWLGYLERIATTVVGWKVWETLSGDIWYAPDLIFDLVNGGTYFRSATIYRNQANALAAGVPARQAYLIDAELTQEEPKANRVRVIPQGWEVNLAPWVLDTWPGSLDDPFDEDTFVGEPITEDLTVELATDPEKVQAIARIYLSLAARRTFNPSIELEKMAPWEIQGGDIVDAGYVAAFEAVNLNTEDQIIVHVEVKPRRSKSAAAGGSFYRTRLVGEKLPFGTGAVEGMVPGQWPGNGA